MLDKIGKIIPKSVKRKALKSPDFVFDVFKTQISGDKFSKSIPTSTSLPQKTSKFRSFIIKYSPDCRKRISLQIQEYIEKQHQNFYSELRTYSEVDYFERNKILLKTLLQKSPKDLECTNKEYIAFAEKIKKNLFAKIDIKEFFTSDIEKSIARQIRSRYWDEYDKLDIKRIYLTQNYFRNFNLTHAQKTFSPREVVLEGLKPEIPEVVKESLKKSSNLTLETGSLIGDYSNDEFYDLPMKFAIASYNTFAQKGNAYIKEALPIIFKGIDEEELFRKLDTLSALTKISTQKGVTSTFEIGGRKYTLEAMSQGMEAATYRIKAQDGRSVVFKNYLQENEGDFTFAPKGLYGGLGILREANMAKVVDVPRLYLANPIVSPINGVMHQSFAYQGGWAIVEDVQNRTALKDGLKFLDWIKEKGLEASDINTTGNILNGFCVDTGFIMPAKWRKFYASGWKNYDVDSVCMNLVAGKNVSEIMELLN